MSKSMPSHAFKQFYLDALSFLFYVAPLSSSITVLFSKSATENIGMQIDLAHILSTTDGMSVSMNIVGSLSMKCGSCKFVGIAHAVVQHVDGVIDPWF